MKRFDKLKDDRGKSIYLPLLMIAAAIALFFHLEGASRAKSETVSENETVNAENVINVEENHKDRQDLQDIDDPIAPEIAGIAAQEPETTTQDDQKSSDRSGKLKEDTVSKIDKKASKKNRDKKNKGATNKEKAKKADYRLIINTGKSIRSFKGKIKKNTSVFDLLKELSRKNKIELSYQNSAFGAFIDGINGTNNEPAKNRYWMFKVNGEMSMVGASDRKVVEGDVIEWYYGEVSGF